MTQEQEIIQCLAMLKLAYPRQELEEGTIDIYEMALCDIDPALLKTAVLQHIAASKWFPTVAELRESALGIVNYATGQVTAGEAWGELMAMFRRGYSHYRVPDFAEQPLIGKALAAIGGWGYLCASENTVADRARFIEVYNQLLRRQQDDAMMLPAVRTYAEQLAAGRINGSVAQLAARLMDWIPTGPEPATRQKNDRAKTD